MAGETKVKKKHQVPVILDADKLEDFKDAIKPYGISDFFRKQQDDVVAEFRKAKEEGRLNLDNYIKPKDEKQVTLDLFKITDKRELVEALQNCQDMDMIRKVRELGGIAVDITRTRLRKK